MESRISIIGNAARELSEMKSVYKARTLAVYQCTNKEEMADFYRLPFSAYYNISCSAYSVLRGIYLAHLDVIYGAIKSLRDTPYDYCKRNGCPFAAPTLAQLEIESENHGNL